MFQTGDIVYGIYDTERNSPLTVVVSTAYQTVVVSQAGSEFAFLNTFLEMAGAE